MFFIILFFFTCFSTLTFGFNVYPESLTLTADEKLVEQILINLMRNAIDASEGVVAPEVRLKAFESHGDVLIKVGDNGQGIPAENMDNIFPDIDFRVYA